MPELPEVETIRRALAPELEGRRILRVAIHHDDLILGGPTPAEFADALEGRRIGRVGRRGKYLLLPLRPPTSSPADAPERVVRVQLRMTGRFWLDRRPPDPEEFRHPGVELRLDDGRTLHYDDIRRLGGFDLLTPEAWREMEARLGPEPLGPRFSARTLSELLGSLRAPIKNVLLDQRRVAGVGNIYASEALHRARIDPRRPAGTLDAGDTRRLHRSIRAVLRDALRDGGSTLRDYRALNGAAGSFQTRLRVYGRDGEPCGRCGTRIRRIVQAGRSTFFCADCQR